MLDMCILYVILILFVYFFSRCLLSVSVRLFIVLDVVIDLELNMVVLCSRNYFELGKWWRVVIKFLVLV